MNTSSISPVTSKQPKALPSNPARGLATSHTIRVLVFLLANTMLALILDRSPTIATLHALAVFALGLYFLLNDRHPYRLIYVCAYIVGAELLWRGSGATVFWEFGKYSVSTLMILSLFKEQNLFRSSKWGLIYFLLLLPSILLLPNFDREDVSFNLSGPFALAVATTYFSAVQLTRHHIRRILLIMLGPIVGLAFLSAFRIVMSSGIYFVPGTKSLSAGIGPNQVSSVLGLGILIAFLAIFLERESRFLRLLFVVLTTWLIAQTALTLSRGGLWTALGAVAVSTLFLLRDRRTRGAVLGTILAIALLFNFVLFPWLDTISAGTLSYRLQALETSGRAEIIAADFIAFEQNPLFGLGPGQSYDFHAITFRPSSAHTEYTRTLAEHGGLGLIALLILLGVSLNRWRKPATSTLSRALIISFTAWPLLYMLHSAMRLVAPAFIFAVAAATINLRMTTEVHETL